MAAIVKTRRTDDCLHLELDSGEIFRIPLKVAGQYRLESCRALAGEEYDQLKAESRRYGAMKKSLDYLAIRPRSEAEMERYLARKNFDRETIDETVTSLRQSGYLNDADYAARFIAARLSRKAVGTHLLMSELLKRGVDRNLIRKALRESESLHGDPDMLYRTAARKFASLKHKKNPRDKLFMFLRGRGFEPDAVAEVIERIVREEDPEGYE